MGAHRQDGRRLSAIFLCRIDELADPGTKNVVLGTGEDELDIVIVQAKGVRHAYINCCPHEYIPLETFPNHFLTDDKKFLVCSGHGAQFALDSGECVSGPCLGRGLDRLRTAERDDALYLDESLPPEEIARNKRASRRW
jgi:nitrite reductase/ring-hydroxylating ferredoxin subunit